MQLKNRELELSQSCVARFIHHRFNPHSSVTEMKRMLELNILRKPVGQPIVYVKTVSQ